MVASGRNLNKRFDLSASDGLASAGWGRGQTETQSKKDCVMRTELLGGFLKYQKAWLADGSRFKIGLWARQTGKDFTCAAEAVLDCIETPRCHWLILACGERQAKESLEKAKEFVRAIQGEGLRFKG